MQSELLKSCFKVDPKALSSIVRILGIALEHKNKTSQNVLNW